MRPNNNQKKKEPSFLSESILYLQEPQEQYFLPNLRALKEELDRFFREFHVPGWQIGQMRDLITEGRIMYGYRESVRQPPDEHEVECGSLLGLYAITAGFEDGDINFVTTFPDFSFEQVLKGVGPGMTPENTPVLRQLDKVLALCEKERTKK